MWRKCFGRLGNVLILVASALILIAVAQDKLSFFNANVALGVITLMGIQDQLEIVASSLKNRS